MHVLTLFDGHFFVDLKHGRVIEAQTNVSEGEDGLHGHEKRYTSFNRKRVWWEWILQQELVELANLLAAKREDVNQRQEAFDVEGIALAEP